MVHASEQRGAATELAGEYADYDDEYAYHQTLVSDEVFGTLALLTRQSAILWKYNDLEGDVRTTSLKAASELSDALDIRAEQLRTETEVEDAE